MDERAPIGPGAHVPLEADIRAALRFLTGGSIDNSKRSLLGYLKARSNVDDRAAKPFRLPVERIDAAEGGLGIVGTVAGSRLRPGDEIAVLPGGRTTTIKSIFVGGREVEVATAGNAVAVTLADDIEVAPGDMLAAARARPQVADQFAAHLVWLSKDRLQPGRSYLIEINGNTMPAVVTELKYRLDIDTVAQLATRTLGPDESGVCNLSVARPVAFDAYADNRETGAFVLVDRYSNETVAVGMIDFTLRRASNIHHQHLVISKAERAELMSHKPAVLWFTGRPGAGKSTIANLVEAGLHARGVHTLLLDGDNVRHGLNRDLGFTETDRVENIRRVGEVAKLMTEAGLIVLCSFIIAVQGGAAHGAGARGRGRVHRGLCRYPARRMHRTRPQGSLCPRARRRDQELHRRRPGL